MSRKPLATIDSETDPFKFRRVPKPFLWDIYDGSAHFTFPHLSDALHFLSDKAWIVYAHNGGKFDYLLPGFLDAISQFSKVMIINGRLAKFSIGACEFRDSYNILPIPLRDFDKGEIDYAKMEKAVRHKHMAEITTYLHRDTESLYRLVAAFRETYGNGLTLAGSAMKFWETRTRTRSPESSRGFYNEVAPFYHGGRVECFHVGEIKKPFRMIDINSAYPFAMLSEHPIDPEELDVRKYDGGEIVGHWLYQLTCVSRGALAFHVKGKGLDFPDDDVVREYHTTGWELKTALDYGLLDSVKISCVRVFTKTINFSKYIHFFYDMKKCAPKGSPEYVFAKLFMNSLYGKFGANPSNYSNFELVEPRLKKPMEKDGYTFAGELGPWVVMASPLTENEERYYNVSTAASITGQVRSTILAQMCEIRKAGGEILYCDTDSIVFAGGGCPTLNKELGGWSCDLSGTRGGIAGKKLYAFYGTDEKGKKGWKTACKGVRISPQEIMEVARGKVVVYEREAPSFTVKGEPSFITRTVRRTGIVKRKGCPAPYVA